MAWDRPSLEKLIRRAESDIETKLPTVDAFLRRSVENVLAKIQAGAAHSLHGHLQWLSRQLLVDQAEVSFLERHASKYGSAYTRDEATFAEPHRLAEGVAHVFVNGTHTVRDGAHTGALAGRVVRGPGWTGN